MYQALYRAYRPETFDKVWGQDHIIKILKHQVLAGETSHAYLFCGTRGTGKTTVARILAKALNCIGDELKPCGQCINCIDIKKGSFIDLIEIDAASNNSVDNIRELRESVQYPPARGLQKVYIIDEVHMLSKSAFNALLKTLEEPPPSVVFILATTEPEKLPATVLSRCMRMDFRRVAEPVLSKGMLDICKDRNVEIDLDGLELIVANADGSVRDGLTLLDQCISVGKEQLGREDILETLGAVGIETYIQLTDAVRRHDPAEGLMTINKLLTEGKDARQILQGWMAHYRSLLMTQFLKKPESILNLSIENIKRIEVQSRGMELEEINYSILEIAKAIPVARMSPQPRIILEITMVKLASFTKDGQPLIKSKIKQVEENRLKREKVESLHRDEKNLVDTSQIKEIRECIGEDVVPREELVQVSRSESISQEAMVEELADTVEISMEELWTAMLDEGDKAMGGMFGMVRNSANPMSMDGNKIKVQALGMTKRFIEKNQKFIEETLEKYSGKALRIEIVSGETMEEGQEDKKKTLAETVEDVLGMKVEVIREE